MPNVEHQGSRDILLPPIRTVYGDDAVVYFAMVDVIAMLTDTYDSHYSWQMVKLRLKFEGFADTLRAIRTYPLPTGQVGGVALEDCADLRTVLLIAQSVPASPARLETLKHHLVGPVTVSVTPTINGEAAH